MTRTDSYHHGDLAATLVRLAIEKVDTDGAAALSLRPIAQKAGVTPAAVYRHFKNREEILDEVVKYGFDELSNIVIRRVTGRTPAEKFVTAAIGYIQFAETHPNLFSLMFATEGASGRAQVKADESRPENQLRIHLRALQGDKVDDLAYFQAWGMAHGLASLAANGLISSKDNKIKRAFKDLAGKLKQTL